MLSQYGRSKIAPKFLKTSQTLFNSNQINNCSIFLSNYFTTLVVWHRKAAKQSHNICWYVCLTVRSPILLLKSWSQYMHPECLKNSGYDTATSSIFFCLIINIFWKFSILNTLKFEIQCFYYYWIYF